MSFYRWAMRNGATILFVVSIVIFVVTFAASFFLYGSHLGRAVEAEGLTDTKVNIFTGFWGAFAQAASSSVWSFLGACLLYRLDWHWGGSEGPRS